MADVAVYGQFQQEKATQCLKCGAAAEAAAAFVAVNKVAALEVAAMQLKALK